jgi:hypothetical protein
MRHPPASNLIIFDQEVGGPENARYSCILRRERRSEG